MTDSDKHGFSVKYLAATVIILFMALTVCFYIAGLRAKSKELVLLNQNLRSALIKEREENAGLTQKVQRLETLLQNERAAAAKRTASVSSESYRK